MHTQLLQIYKTWTHLLTLPHLCPVTRRCRSPGHGRRGAGCAPMRPRAPATSIARAELSTVAAARLQTSALLKLPPYAPYVSGCP